MAVASAVTGSVPLSTAVVVPVAVGVAGFVTGVNGFGFAVVGTASLASVMDPQSAVTLMILPILAANVSLVGELDRDEFAACAHRFWPYVGAAAVGTVLGMLSLSLIPQRPLSLGLGLFVLAYVALAQDRVTVPGESVLRARCFVETTPMKASVGFASGVVFGVSNVGVQVVAYLNSLELDRATFVGVVAMVFLGVSAVRVVTAASLGLYDGGEAFALSVLAVVPGLIGVAVGRRVRTVVSESGKRGATFALLVVIGIRLTLAGAGV